MLNFAFSFLLLNKGATATGWQVRTYYYGGFNSTTTCPENRTSFGHAFPAAYNSDLVNVDALTSQSSYQSSSTGDWSGVEGCFCLDGRTYGYEGQCLDIKQNVTYSDSILGSDRGVVTYCYTSQVSCQIRDTAQLVTRDLSFLNLCTRFSHDYSSMQTCDGQIDFYNENCSGSGSEPVRFKTSCEVNNHYYPNLYCSSDMSVCPSSTLSLLSSPLVKDVVLKCPSCSDDATCRAMCLPRCNDAAYNILNTSTSETGQIRVSWTHFRCTCSADTDSCLGKYIVVDISPSYQVTEQPVILISHGKYEKEEKKNKYDDYIPAIYAGLSFFFGTLLTRYFWSRLTSICKKTQVAVTSQEAEISTAGVD